MASQSLGHQRTVHKTVGTCNCVFHNLSQLPLSKPITLAKGSRPQNTKTLSTLMELTVTLSLFSMTGSTDGIFSDPPAELFAIAMVRSGKADLVLTL